MSRLAALLMFVSWLLYGAMPAMAMPVMPSSMSMPAMQDHAEHGDMTKMTQTAEHTHGDTRQPCPHGGKTCVTPFCAACLTLLPEIAAGDHGPFRHPYPAPGIELALVYPSPAPLTPPPRA